MIKNKEIEILPEFLNPLWEKQSMEKVLEKLKNMKKYDSSREFEILNLEIEQAYREFIEKIKTLKMIINTRAKGEKNSHFGGQEYAEFMHKIRIYIEKYLNFTNNIQNKFIISLREKAKEDEKNAWKIEQNNKAAYINLKKDKTLETLKIAGYDV